MDSVVGFMVVAADEVGCSRAVMMAGCRWVSTTG
ncbi:proline-rich receptor-like protein kinase PERK2 [Iris pallida]|uniref:Proline-rich receptor-like protein kinase PERK2 n=1 Tax=Iris pallida TaxID=29817 RepID=A0AAX6DMP3_IRIPA|nr:proline-rich receptor-like protein kinase PERK2 [Iris pallida]